VPSHDEGALLVGSCPNALRHSVSQLEQRFTCTTLLKYDRREERRVGEEEGGI